MNSVNVENALMNERARIHTEIMRKTVNSMLDVTDTDHPHPDAITFNGKVYLKATDILAFIGYSDQEV